MSARALWKIDAIAAAMRAARAGSLPDTIGGISIDSRTIAPGEAFFAIKGENRDGHDFVPAALARGAGLAVIAADRRAVRPRGAPLLIVADVLAALRDVGRAARARSSARIAAVTGSVGKTGTKEALRLALAAEAATHASAASYNNQWGVPLSLARMPETARFAVFELGMNHAGELTPLTQLVRPHVAIVTAIEPVHFEYFGSLEAIADAKAEIFLGLEPGGAAVLNRDNAQYPRLRRAAQAAGVARIVSFGEHQAADARLLEVSLQPDCSTVRASILDVEVAYKLGAPGRHIVINSLAVLAAASLLGADLALAAVALANLQPRAGRGARVTLDLPIGKALLIDESYNANPASMRAALDLLAQAPIGKHGTDLVFCAGPLMHALWEVLPSERRGAYAPTALALEPQVLAALRDGDAVMVKGSLGSRMGAIVQALTARFSRRRLAASAQG